MALLSLYAPSARRKRVSLHIDSDTTDLASPATASPSTPIVPRPPSSGSEDEAASRPQPESPAKEKEKRKRCRVTPDQLVHLERFFAADRSPTAARRREISDLLGMQERQTQIWFQNRRAKAKILESKPPTLKARTLSDSPVDLQALIHEDEPVTIIPCTDLSVGTWRRIATAVGKHDLVAYVSDPKRCLTWFVQSDGHGFKMEIPFETIVETQFTNAAPGSGLATFFLSQPPLFYLEQLASPLPDGTPIRYWKRCTDWTEGFQATTVLRHELIGPSPELAHIAAALPTAVASGIALHSPTYSATTTMEIPAPPMAALGADFQHPGSSKLEASRKRFSEPGNLDQSHPWSTISSLPPHSAPITLSFGRGMTPTFDDFQHQMVSSPHLGEYAVPISQRLTSRVPHHRTFSDPQYETLQRPYSTNFTYQLAAPPLLTTPYHPPPYLTNMVGSPHEQISIDNHSSIPMTLPF